MEVAREFMHMLSITGLGQIPNRDLKIKLPINYGPVLRKMAFSSKTVFRVPTLLGPLRMKWPFSNQRAFL
jgi:hypothetical protein